MVTYSSRFFIHSLHVKSYLAMLMKTRTSPTINTSTRPRARSRCSFREWHVTVGLICFIMWEIYTFNNLNEQNKSFNHTQKGQGTAATTTATTTTTTSSSPFVLESFAISLDPIKVKQLQDRNQMVNLGNISWAKATNGMQQETLDLWTQLTKHNHAPMTVEQASKLPKTSYESPHAIGCYLSHWNLWNTLSQRPVDLLLLQQPEKKKNNNNHAYLILEDDATCAPGLKEEIEQTILQLPNDWDILYVGGKPFSYFEHVNDVPDNNNKQQGLQLLQEYKQYDASSNWTARDDTNQRIRQAVCQGMYGKAGGPLAPNGSRSLSQKNQPYWQVHYLTNTDAYVINPNRVIHLTKLLHPSHDVPIDIRLTDLIKSKEINAYMTTRMWCDQRLSSEEQPLLQQPQTWQGFFVFISGDDNNKNYDYVWQTQMHLNDHENCTY